MNVQEHRERPLALRCVDLRGGRAAGGAVRAHDDVFVVFADLGQVDVQILEWLLATTAAARQFRHGCGTLVFDGVAGDL